MMEMAWVDERRCKRLRLVVRMAAFNQNECERELDAEGSHQSA
jgi:hypothetical protein